MASTGTPALSSSATLGMRVNLDCRATTTSRKVCGGALWCTIHQSGGLRLKSMPAAFSCLLDRRVQNRQTLRYLKRVPLTRTYQDISQGCLYVLDRGYAGCWIRTSENTYSA